ncbi:MAG: tyrosine-type recombinase/integrase [Steroidobacteraceae bacterium]
MNSSDTAELEEILAGALHASALNRIATRRGERSARGRGINVTIEGDQWRARWREPADCKGVRRRRSRTIGSVKDFPTKAAALREARRLRPFVMPAQFAPGQSPPWGEVLDRYLAEALPLVRPSSAKQISYALNRHLRPAFPGKRLHEVDTAQLQQFVLTQTGTGVARTTIRARLGYLRTVLGWAQTQGLAAIVPRAGKVKLPRDRALGSRIREKAYTFSQCDAIIAAADLPWRTLYALLGFAGLRVSEGLALSWEDVELSDDGACGTIRVRQAAVRGRISALKAHSSIRDVPIDPRLARHLVKHRDSLGMEGLLFPAPSGHPRWSSGVLARHLDPLLRRLGIKAKRRGFHGLRHLFAINLADALTPTRTVMQLCGHSSLAAAEVYTQTTVMAEREAVERSALRVESLKDSTGHTIENRPEPAEPAGP